MSAKEVRFGGDARARMMRGVGWEYVHVCIDDASRVAFSKIMKSKRKGCAVAFLKAAVHRYNWHRPHASIGRLPPIIRLGLTKDNLLRLHS